MTTSTGESDVHEESGVDEELASRLRVAVNRLNRLLRQESVVGLSAGQVSALGSIKRLGTPTLGELAVVEQVQPPTMTRMVATMETAGLVARLSDAGDRRITRVQLTPAGRRTMEKVRTLKTAYLYRRLSQLDEAERAAAIDLTALLERLGERL